MSYTKPPFPHCPPGASSRTDKIAGLLELKFQQPGGTADSPRVAALFENIVTEARGNGAKHNSDKAENSFAQPDEAMLQRTSGPRLFIGVDRSSSQPTLVRSCRGHTFG